MYRLLTLRIGKQIFLDGVGLFQLVLVKLLYGLASIQLCLLLFDSYDMRKQYSDPQCSTKRAPRLAKSIVKSPIWT